MSDALIVFCACQDEAEATRLADALVEERLAACVNILPGIRSVYRWQGKVEHASEVLLLAKTAAESFNALQEKLTALHSYDTPEILAVPVSAGTDKYLAWLAGQL
jgi:periplasmic divalent cation tolerance protein